MGNWGLTSTGFTIPRQSDIISEIQASLIALFGPQINLVAPSVFSQLVGIFAEREALLWELALGVYNSQYPDYASGSMLDNVASITGITRLPATYSVQTGLRLFGTVGTVINPGQLQVSPASVPTSIFQNTTGATLIAGTNEQQQLLFSSVPAAGAFQVEFGNQTSTPIPYNASANTVQTALNTMSYVGGCTVTGNFTSGFTVTFGGVSGLQPQNLLTITNNTLFNGSAVAVTVTVTELVLGVCQGTVNCQALVTGPVTAPAYSMTNILTPISGLSSVLNVIDAVAGQAVESDAAFKARRIASLSITASATVSAIYSKVSQVVGVTGCLVFENVTDSTDGFGRPPHSIQVLVSGTYAAADVANAIWNSKPAGVATYGTSSYVITDSQGIAHTIYYSAPTIVDLYCIVNITRDTTGEVAAWPTNGVQLVQAALSEWISTLAIGRDVVVLPEMMAAINSIPGIYAAVILVGTSPNPNSSNPIVITSVQQARLLTSNITVNVT